jgi:serine/threonine-protein kinase
MEFVEGRTVRTALDADGPPPVDRAVTIVQDVCTALEFAHRRGVLHRGVCPENVMIDSSGAVKVMDFGMSRRAVAGDDDPARPAEYLSPEQARGEPVDARSDVYGTGCLLYELLTGAAPFTGDDPVTVAYRQVGEPARPPSEASPDLPADLDAIVLKALAKDPLDRYQSVADLRGDLAREVVGAPTVAAAAATASAGRPVGAGRPGSTRHPAAARMADPRPAAGPPLLAPPTRTQPVDDTEPASARRGRRVASFVGFGVVCVVGLAAAMWLTLTVVTAPPPARPVAVPDLSGMTLDEARQTLSGKDLLVGAVTEQDSTPDQTGRIVEQRPSGRTEVAGRTPVNLVVGRGVSVVAVPDLDGLTPDRARQALAAVGLVYSEQQQPSSDADRGKVLAQSPAAHEPSAPGSTVAVTVGTGLPMVTVPDGIVGVSVDDATAILVGAGLTAVGVEQDGTPPAGIVIGTDYSPGQQVPEGSPITLSYSNNALMVMPNLTGRGQDAAATLLRGQGWAGDASTMTVSSAPAASPNLIGAVVTQQPAAGAVVRKLGTPVAIGIGVRQITMPALIGRARGDAEAVRRAAGATRVTFVDGGTAPRGQAGRVAAQSVPSGSAITADTALVVTVYRA